MNNPLVESLPLPCRFALSHAPRRAQAATLALLALDARLASLLRQGREPMLAQLRLAWWRDLIAQPLHVRPAGDPLIASLRIWEGEEASLAGLVAGWETLAATDRFRPAEAKAFVEGRGSAFAGLARLLGAGALAPDVSRAAEIWAVADLASHLSDPGERAAALEVAASMDVRRIALPRVLRPLAVLHGLGRRSLAIGNGAPLLHDVASSLLALRLGILGR